ncbi:Rgp1-domain-containing protein [Phycomyces blakesleeanus]|uniref:Rgp1-domain-containing protein n=1 Tax=Phycomyces blakesleeanus TaxID=4837 RepID=A0ABR3AX17_PHYBL
MSVLVNTVFSQGAVFYAGETVSCTIQFSNPLPSLPSQPSTSSSSSSHTRHSRSKSPLGHSRSQSLSSAELGALGKAEVPKNTSRNVEGLVLAGLTAKASSLASSTFSFLTGYASQKEPERPEPTWEPHSLSGVEESVVRLMDQTQRDDHPISIELDAHDGTTPRSSSDTHSILLRENIDSRRSSMDSLASTAYQRQHLNAQRLSNLLKSSHNKKPEHILWGFAQIVGNFVVDPALINNNEFASLKHRTMYRPNGGGIGGGGLLGTKPEAHSKIDTRTTPVFSTPPSVLFVDLDLAPGETKKFSYKHKLPNDIPPSHRGKAIRFNYYLVVGTQRLNSLTPGQVQVVQIPFRVLNHVSEDGSRPVYDLMNPVVIYNDEAIVDTISDEDSKKNKIKSSKGSKKAGDNAREAFLDYVDELLENSAKNASIHEITRRESDAYDEPSTDQEEGGIESRRMSGKTCAQIVSRVTNGSRKAMYDICKNNQRVAQLHLIKTAYRLGEPVMGVLDFQGAALSTFEVSILLESSEIVEPSIALRQPQHIARISRKCHAEHHSFCLGHRRLAFSLPIPAIASPEFQTTGVKLQYYLKFEFITSNGSNPLAPPFIPINIDERHRHYQALQDVQVSTFDCQIPIRIYGSSGGADRALYGRPHTFFVQ